MVVLTFHVHIVQDPVEVDGEWNKFLGKLDYGFTCIFAIEVLLKVTLSLYHAISINFNMNLFSRS